MDIEKRRAELEAMPWTDVRSLCRKYGIEKPVDSDWMGAIPTILQHERMEAESESQRVEAQPRLDKETQSEIVSEPKKQSPTINKTPPEPKNQFATHYYSQLNFNVCPRCGEKKRTFAGKQICPMSYSDCEFVPKQCPSQ